MQISLVNVNYKSTLNEAISVEDPILWGASEGPTGTTYKLSFLAQVVYEDDDMQEALSAFDIDEEDLKTPEKKFKDVGQLIDALSDPEYHTEVINKLINHGIMSVVNSLTHGEFGQLLEFLRDNGLIDVAMKIRSPKYWTHLNYDARRGDIGKRFTDLRAGSKGKGSTADKDSRLQNVWQWFIDKSKDEIVEKIANKFADMPTRWQDVILGQDNSNIKIDVHRGDKKFGTIMIAKAGGSSETDRSYVPRSDIDIEDGGEPTRWNTDTFKKSWHYPYRSEPSYEQQGEKPYLSPKETNKRLSPEFQETINAMPQRLEELVKQKAAADAAGNTALANKIKAEYRAIYLEYTNILLTYEKKHAVFVWVSIDLDPLISELEKSFAYHIERQEEDQAYAKATRHGKQIEIWPSGLFGLKQFMLSAAEEADDQYIVQEILEAINEAMGIESSGSISAKDIKDYALKHEDGSDVTEFTEHWGYKVVDIGNNGWVYYKPYSNSKKIPYQGKQTSGICGRCGQESNNLVSGPGTKSKFVNVPGFASARNICQACYDTQMLQWTPPDKKKEHLPTCRKVFTKIDANGVEKKIRCPGCTPEYKNKLELAKQRHETALDDQWIGPAESIITDIANDIS